MTCLIPCFSQRMKNVAEITGKQPLPHERINASDGCIVIWEGDAIVGKHQVDDSFPDHSQLYQA